MSNSATGAASESDAAVHRTTFSKQAAATTGLIACVAGACYAGYELFSLLLDFPEPCRLAVQTAQSSADLTQLVTTYTHVLSFAAAASFVVVVAAAAARLSTPTLSFAAPA